MYNISLSFAANRTISQYNKASPIPFTWNLSKLLTAYQLRNEKRTLYTYTVLTMRKDDKYIKNPSGWNLSAPISQVLTEMATRDSIKRDEMTLDIIKGSDLPPTEGAAIQVMAIIALVGESENFEDLQEAVDIPRAMLFELLNIPSSRLNEWRFWDATSIIPKLTY